jgi:hypothetical protein
MVQIQSSWFPLYDRNPQTFVANPFWAKPEDYKKATQRIYHAPRPGNVHLPTSNNAEVTYPRSHNPLRGHTCRRERSDRRPCVPQTHTRPHPRPNSE